jgi:hypothetical protein
MEPFSTGFEKIERFHREAATHAALKPLLAQDRARVVIALKTLWNVTRVWIFGFDEHKMRTRAQPFTNSSTSRVKRSLCVANKPCGAPSYSMNFEFLMPAAATRLEMSIGTILSSVP